MPAFSCARGGGLPLPAQLALVLLLCALTASALQFSMNAHALVRAEPCIYDTNRVFDLKNVSHTVDFSMFIGSLLYFFLVLKL